ncbi:unnamed protein product [Ectocarpus sp. 12 AP-2014]
MITGKQGDSFSRSAGRALFATSPMSLKVYQTPSNLDLARRGILDGARTHIRNNFVNSGSTGGGLEDARALQDACPSGSPLFVSSSMFPFAEGCYVASDTLLSGGEPVYFITSATSPGQTILAAPKDPDDDDEGPLFWGVAYVTSSTAVLQCASVEDASLVNPADAAWMCDETGTSNFQTVSNDTLFSVSCGGCSSATPAPTAATTAAPTIFIGGEDCGALTVSAPSAPHLEGCYFDTRLTQSWYSEFVEIELPSFTQDGSLAAGQLWLSWLSYATNETLWGLFFYPTFTSSSEQLVSVYCLSQEEVTEATPANTTWDCDLDGDYSTTFGIEKTKFSVTCGCATGSAQGGTLSESPTPAPTPGPTPSPTLSGCMAGDPFLVTLPAVPQVEGCYVDSNLNDTAGYPIYRSTGGAESADGQSFVLPTGDGPVEETYYKDWTLVLFEFGTEEPRVICSRGMDGSDGTNGHPAHEVASAYDDTPGVIFWHCDLEGTGNVSYINASSSIFRIECGCASSLDFNRAMGREIANQRSLGTTLVLLSLSMAMGVVLGAL